MPSKSDQVKRKARKYISRHGISRNRTCAVCKEKKECVIHVVNESNEFLVVFLCRSCLAEWTGNHKLPSKSHLESLAVDLRNLPKNEVTPYNPSAFRQRRKRFLSKHPSLKRIPCLECGSQDTFYYTDLDRPNIDPLIVRPLCRSCKGKYNYKKPFQKKASINLRELASSEKESLDPGNYQKACKIITKTYLAYYQPSLERTCQYCRDSIKGSLNFIYPSIKNPLRVFIVCSECHSDYEITKEELYLNSIEPINLISQVVISEEDFKERKEEKEKSENKSEIENRNEKSNLERESKKVKSTKNEPNSMFAGQDQHEITDSILDFLHERREKGE